MSGFSNYLADRIINTDLDGAFVALFNGDPTDTGSGGTEVTTTIRAAGRVPISLGAPTGSSGTRSAVNDAVVDFGDADGAVASVTHFALFDATTGGNLLASGQLSAPQTIAANNPVRFAVGALTVSVT